MQSDGSLHRRKTKTKEIKLNITPLFYPMPMKKLLVVLLFSTRACATAEARVNGLKLTGSSLKTIFTKKPWGAKTFSLTVHCFRTDDEQNITATRNCVCV